MSGHDTGDDARRVQFELLRRTSGARRIATAVQLTALARELALAGIRSRHAGASAERIDDEYCRLVYGEELAAKVRARRRLGRRSTEDRA